MTSRNFRRGLHRVDAQASDSRVGIGGWLPSIRSDGSFDLCSSYWFSLELKRDAWPWIYEKSEKQSLIISTLEALAVLFSLLLFFDSPSGGERKRVQVAPTWTDNRANGSALNKLMTPKFLARAAITEMAVQLMKRVSGRHFNGHQGQRTGSGRDPQRGRKQTKRKVEDRMKMKDPW